jgi:hypothetical protein
LGDAVMHDELLTRNADALNGILGLAYKENTRSTKNSHALVPISMLAPWRLKVYDPIVPASAAGHPGHGSMTQGPPQRRARLRVRRPDNGITAVCL